MVKCQFLIGKEKYQQHIDLQLLGYIEYFHYTLFQWSHKSGNRSPHTIQWFFPDPLCSHHNLHVVLRPECLLHYQLSGFLPRIQKSHLGISFNVVCPFQHLSCRMYILSLYHSCPISSFQDRYHSLDIVPSQKAKPETEV